MIIASGACNKPAVPAFADAVPASVDQLTPFDYRNPDHLAEGGVLVVGASATGVQLAAELLALGAPGDPLSRGTRAVAPHLPRP